MINLKATYLVAGQKVNKIIPVPVMWKDVTYDQYCRIITNIEKDRNKNLANQIHILTGIALEDIMQFDYDLVQRICTMIGFSYDYDSLNNYNTIPVKWRDFKIGNGTYGNIMECNKRLKSIHKNKQPDFFLCKELCMQYLKKDISNEPITEVFGYCNFFLHCFLNLKNGIATLENGNTSPRNWKPGLKGLVKSMGISSR